MIFVTREEYKNRRDICKKCIYHNRITTQCQICSCFMVAKCAFSQSECPIGKWEKSNSKEKVDPIDEA